MPNTVNLLSKVTSSPDWPPHWMTIEEIAAELDRRGLLHRQPFSPLNPRTRLDFLRGILVGPTWVRLGLRIKHAALLTDVDHALVEDWLEERDAALDEDLARIILG